jgi:hypothetical protein
MPTDPIDSTCLIHGKKYSEHECLFCCLCFKSLTVEECAYLPNGKKEDVCVECAMNELARLPFEFQKRAEEKNLYKQREKEAQKWMEHLSTCPKIHPSLKIRETWECSCGLDAFLAKVK